MVLEDVVAFFERCCRVVDTLTLSTSVTAHAPAIVRESAFDVPALSISTSLVQLRR